MKCLTLAILATTAICANQAWGFACRSFPDHNEIDLPEVIGLVGDPNKNSDKSEKLIPDCPAGVIDLKKPSTFFLASPGGNIDQMQAFAAQLRAQIENAYESSQTMPTVVVHKQCESACIPILSALNKMAQKRTVRLIVDRDTILGFHGCSDHALDAPEDDEGTFSREGTRRYLTYWQILGGNPDWIREYFHFFESADLHQMSPEDSRLKDAQLLDYAEIGAAVDFRARLKPIAAVSLALP